MTKVPFFRHQLGSREVAAVAEALEGPILTTGEIVDRFEEEFAAYLGLEHCVATTSCTGALHLALLALGVDAGDEVITTPMTFVASATAILQAGARPVFVDVEPRTGNLAAENVEAAITPKTRAILVVHLYGQMCDMRAVRAVADRHGLAVVEDAAHCVEGRRDGVRPGMLGDAACFSFYATKSITSGEGGAIAVRSADLRRRLRSLRHHGMTKTAIDRLRGPYEHWDVQEFGWKYNMDNIQAALLLPQLGDLESNWRRRDRLVQRYEAALSDVTAVAWPETVPGSKHARHMFTVWVDPEHRDSVIAALQRDGIGIAVNYRAVHLLSYFRDRFGFAPGCFRYAERIGASTITLPLYPAMPEEHVPLVAEALKRVLRGD